MMRFNGVLAAVAALALVSGVATACDGQKTAQKVSAEKASCASKTSAKTVSADSGCASKTAAKTASASGHCSSAKAMTASASGHCGSAKAMTASAGSCAAKAMAASANCVTTHVVYRVGETETFDRAEAFATAEKSGAAVQFVAAGEAYDSEDAAKSAMTQAMVARLNEMLTVSTNLGGEASSCGSGAKTADKSSGEATKFVVAGKEFESKDAAEAYLVKVRAAVDAIQLTDAEGHAVKGCADGYAKKTGATAFKLGDKTIECAVDANYVATQAKLAAALSLDA